MNRRYTVIGAGGFIGSRMVSALAADGIVAFAPGRGDEAWLNENLGHVIYCAGMTGDYRARPFATVEAHVSLLSRLLERGRFERIVFLSSTRLYGLDRGTEGRESLSLVLDPNDPQHIYELTKALGENLTLNWSGGRGAVARLAYVFDWTKGAEGFLSDWLRAAETGRDLKIASSPAAGRDYIHVDDVVRALRALIDSDVTALVNVATGKVTDNLTLAQVFGAEGWTVDLDPAAFGWSPPRLDVTRLASLGVRPRDAVDVVRERLRALSAR